MRTEPDKGSGSAPEPESQPTRLEWDGIQFVPSTAIPDESLPQMPITAPAPLLSILAFVVGLIVFGFGLELLWLAAGDVTPIAIGSLCCAVGAGLMVWSRVELTRIKPLPKRWQDLDLAERLSHTLHFTPAELGLNRRGRLSLVQRLRLLGFDLGWWLTVLACFGVVAGVLAAAGLFNPIKDLRALFLVVLGLYALWKASSTLIDAVGGRVRTELTSLQPILSPGNWMSDLLKDWTDSTVYYAYEGKDGLVFAVSRAAYEALTPGRYYHVYFMPLSKRLMSVEAAGD